MINQKILKAPEEYLSIVDESEGLLSVLSDKIYSINEIENPGELYGLIKDYVLRNIMPSTSKDFKKMIVCKRCVKAYIENLCCKFFIDLKLLSPIFSVLNCKSGHEGFFLDEEGLFKI